MLTQDHSAHQTPRKRAADKVGRRSWWVFGGFAAVALVLLAAEHRAHLLGWLPWLILLACPLMHVFMHGGHGGHGGTSNEGEDK